MRGSVRSPRISYFIGAFAALWLSAGPAWAGHGGGDVASVQSALDAACTALDMTTCPQLPTFTQLVLEIAGLENAPPEAARFENAISPTVAVNAVNPPAGSPFDLSKVTPLAFISPSTSGGVAMVTQPADPNANSFFYAATNGTPSLPPVTLFLVYDYPPLTTSNFAKGQLVADISIPLVVLNSNGTETEAPITIQILGATGCGKIVPCVSATAVGSFGTVDAAKLGLTVTLTFRSSANSAAPHAIFGVQAPLLVTHSNDLAYFVDDPVYTMNPLASLPPVAFINDEQGFTPKSGLPVGVAPYAAPKCPNNSCPLPPPPSNFPFCASIAGNDGTVRPAVAAFFSIGTVGTTYLSAPLVSPQGVTCPF